MAAHGERRSSTRIVVAVRGHELWVGRIREAESQKLPTVAENNGPIGPKNMPGARTAVPSKSDCDKLSGRSDAHRSADVTKLFSRHSIR